MSSYNSIGNAPALPAASVPDMHFFGARRSGNHAVLGWIMANAEANGFATEHFNDIYDSLTSPPKLPEYGDPSLLASDETQLAIYSYQDVSVEEIPQIDFYTSAPREKTTVRVLRDLPNLIASRIAMYEDLDRRGLSHRSVRQIPLEAVTDLWVGYAHDYVENPSPDGGTINFPLWFQNRGYRNSVYESFGLGPNRDVGLENVADFGFGSSFDFRAFDGRAQEMKVLERWQQYREDPRYIEAISSHPDVATLMAEFQRITHAHLVQSGLVV
jgi:hypothetical protein